jgi:hypothetical protein
MVHMGMLVHCFILHYIILILRFYLQFYPCWRGGRGWKWGWT